MKKKTHILITDKIDYSLAQWYMSVIPAIQEVEEGR
jgi:hypothetical protein